MPTSGGPSWRNLSGSEAMKCSRFPVQIGYYNPHRKVDFGKFTTQTIPNRGFSADYVGDNPSLRFWCGLRDAQR